MERGRFRSAMLLALAAGLFFFTAAATNLPLLRLRSQLVIFVGLALVYAFLSFPLALVFRRSRWALSLDWVFASTALLVSLFLVYQFESSQPYIPQGVAFLGLLLLLEALRRAIGWALPILAFLFGVYGLIGPYLPGFLLPHRGFTEERLLAQCFLPGQGIFGMALEVTFRHAFLLVVLAVWLDQLGGPAWVLQALDRRFGKDTGGAGKVAVLGSGILGTIAPTPAIGAGLVGPFCLPRIRYQGLERASAAGTLAAASLGSVLVPPFLGVGAYLMLTLVGGSLGLPGLLAASIIPSLLYFFSLYLGVVLRARRDEAENQKRADDSAQLMVLPELPPLRPVSPFTVFLLGAGVAALLAPLLLGFPVAAAAPMAFAATLGLSLFRRGSRPSPATLSLLLRRSADAALPLVLASAGVGVVLGIAELTGLGQTLQALFPRIAQFGLFPALLAMAAFSLVAGLALPSAVVYLLLALLLGPALAALGPLPLAAHFFLLYCGLMATITPPVANAAQAAAGMAGARLLPTSLYACRLSLVGFALPFLIVYRPELLMLGPSGGSASVAEILIAGATAILGVFPLAAADTGYFGRRLGPAARLFFLAVALAIFYPAAGPPNEVPVTWLNLFGVLLLAAASWAFLGLPGRAREPGESTPRRHSQN